MESSNKLAIQKQVEYYLSDQNLKQDEFFNNIIQNNETHSIPIESLLNCNKIKKLNATKEQIIEAVGGSGEIEIVGEGVKRKGDKPIPAFEPKITKKIKGENGPISVPQKADREETKEFEPKIFKITVTNAAENLRWDVVQTEIQNATGVKPKYTRLNNAEGHFAVDDNTLTEEEKNKIVNAVIKVGDAEVKLEECLDEDLKKFYADHGRHLDMCLERAGLKKKDKFRKDKKDKKDKKAEPRSDAIDFVFFNKRYTSLTPLKYIFKGILQKTDDDDIIGENDQKLLTELLKYHDSYDEKIKDLKHFTVGQHPLYKQTRCFFVVRNDGTREDFSSTKCIENIQKKYGAAQ